MKAKVLYFLIGIAILLSMASCLEKEEFPDEPVIKFNSLTNSEDELVLNFSFTDGDGNFGLEDGDSLAPFNEDPYQQNLKVTYFELQEGVWQRFGTDFPEFSPYYISLGFSQKVPWVKPTGQRKVQEGEITYDILNYFVPNTGYDTCRYDFFIYDRDLNASNTETTTIFLKP